MSNRPVTMAIVGFSGLIGKRHTKHVLSSPHITLVALVDPSPIAADMATSLSTPYFVSVTEMLASNIIKPDAAIVCTPNSTHVSVAKQLAAAGINLLVEKPLSTTFKDGKELVNLAMICGVKLLVGHHRRFNPYVIATKSAIDSGSLGQVTAVSGLWTSYKPAEYFDASPALKWRSSRRGGGGVVLINFVHEIDLLHHFFGPTVKVHAEKTVSRRGWGEDKAEEGAVLILTFESGVVGTVVLSDCVVSPHNFETGTGENPVIRRTRREEEVDVYRIFGTEATLSVPDMKRWSYGDGRKSWENQLVSEKLEIDSDRRVPFERQLDHFVRVVRGEENPGCSGEEGLRAMAVCDAVRRALDADSGTAFIPQIDLRVSKGG